MAWDECFKAFHFLFDVFLCQCLKCPLEFAQLIDGGMVGLMTRLWDAWMCVLAASTVGFFLSFLFRKIGINPQHARRGGVGCSRGESKFLEMKGQEH